MLNDVQDTVVMCLTVKLHNIVAYSVTSVIASGLFHCMIPAVSCQHPFRTYNERIGASLEHCKREHGSQAFCTALPACITRLAANPGVPAGLLSYVPKRSVCCSSVSSQYTMSAPTTQCQLPPRNVSSHYAMSAPTAQCQLPLHNVSSNYTISAWHLSVYNMTPQASLCLHHSCNCK